jgi:hypothetical protein
MVKEWLVLFLAFLLPLFSLAAADETVIAGFSFRPPPAWQAAPINDAALTRLADWNVAGGGEIVVFRFGNDRPGDVQLNVNRWASSVTTPQGTPAAATISTRKIDVYPVTQIEAFGTYFSPESGAPGLPPAALPGYGLVGAVLELPSGPLYVRLTGPEAVVRRTLPDLTRFLESVRPPPAAPATKG